MHRANDFLIKLMLTLLVLMTSISVQAASTTQQSIYIESDSLRIDEQKEISHYQGNVKFKQGTLVITANNIKLMAKEGAIDKVIIDGEPTRLTQQSQGKQPAITATANRIEYIASTEILHLYGNVQVTQGNQHFSGEHIQYNNRTSQITAQGINSMIINQQTRPDGSSTTNGQDRVKAIITPKRESTSP